MNNEEIKIGKRNYVENSLMFLEEVDLLELIYNLDKREQLKKLISNLDNRDKLYESMAILRNKKMNNVEKNTALLEKKYMAYLSFDNIAKKTKNSNRIFFYIGWPKTCQQNDIINCRLYKDLETGMEVKVQPADYEEFEKEYRVIVPNYDVQDCDEDKITAFYEARENFFSYLIDDSQEVAVKKILQIKNKF